MNLFFALSAQNETNFFKNLWNYLYDVYLRVDGSYENIGFEKTPLFSLRLTVLGIFVGAIIACGIMAYNKQVIGNAIRKLIEQGANSPENAQTLKELGYNKNFLMRNAFRSSVTLRKTVKCVAEEEFYLEQKQRREEHEKKQAEGEKLPKFKEIEYLTDINTDRFYIPEESKIHAGMKFNKKGSGWLASILGMVILCVIFFAVLLVLPLIFGAIDEFLGTF